MRKIICLVLVMLFFSTTTFAATYYDVNVEGLISSEKQEVVQWLKKQGFDYDVSSYTSSNSNAKVIVVEDLTYSEKNTLVNWLESNRYEYASKNKNNYYYVTIECTSSTKNSIISYLDRKGYYYGGSTTSSSSERDGEAYLVANGTIWYANGENIDEVDTVYSSDCIAFTEDGAIVYINKSNKGKLITNVNNPKRKSDIASSVTRINLDSDGYAVSFGWGSRNRNTKRIENDDEFNNEKMTVYVLKGNALYSLSSKNSLKHLKTLQKCSNNTYNSKNYANIGFSEWGDLVCVDEAGVIWFNEKINKTNRFESLKNQYNKTVKARYLNVNKGVITTVVLDDGSVLPLDE